MTDTLVIYDRFEVRYDGDVVTLVCLACGATLYFTQDRLAFMHAAAEEHALTECGQHEEE